MLMQRKSMMEHILISKVEWLIEEIVKRGFRVSSLNSHNTHTISVKNSIKLLEGMLTQTKKNVFELSITISLDFKNILMLNYYRNGLIHIFCLEGICITSLYSFGSDQFLKQGVSLPELVKSIKFLA